MGVCKWMELNLLIIWGDQEGEFGTFGRRVLLGLSYDSGLVRIIPYQESFLNFLDKFEQSLPRKFNIEIFRIQIQKVILCVSKLVYLDWR